MRRLAVNALYFLGWFTIGFSAMAIYVELFRDSLP